MSTSGAHCVLLPPPALVAVGHSVPEPVALVDLTAAGEDGAGVPEVFTYLLDALGNVVALADDSGAVVEQYVYDPYGQTYIEDAAGQSRPTSAYGNPFMWTGQRYDAVTGLYGFTFRTYSPTLGRWLQRDPLGYVDGVNLYEYAGSDPTGNVDPLGLFLPEFVVYPNGTSREVFEAQVKFQGECLDEASEAADAALNAIGRAYQDILPEEVHAFLAGGGHIPVLDPGTAQDTVLITSNVLAVFAPVPGAQARAGNSGMKLIGFIVRVDDGYAMVQAAANPSLGGLAAAAGLVPNGGRLDDTLECSRRGPLRVSVADAGADGFADDLLQHAHNVEPLPGFTDFYVHANGKTFVFGTATSPSGTVGHRGLAKLLKQRGVEGDIRLISCKAGKYDLAQNLANKLGVTVRAATTNAGVPISLPISGVPIPPIALDGGKWIDFIPGGSR